MTDTVFRRVLIKLSGEVLAGEKGFGIDTKAISKISEEIRDIYEGETFFEEYRGVLKD
jgi:uridylate kinase